MKFEDLYNQELASNERLRSALSLPLGLLIAIGSLLGLMLQSLWFERNSLAIAFYAAAFGSSWFFVQTMYYLVRSYHGHVYKGMPFPLTQHAYRDELREWHTKNGKGPQDGDREWEDAIEFQYAQAADHNARLNLNRSQYLFLANGAIIKCVILTVLAFVPFGVHKATHAPPPQEIKIVNSVK